jgi:hypothetical protein
VSPGLGGRTPLIGWSGPERLRTWGRFAAVLLALFVYAGALGNDFLVDDEIIVTANIRLAPGQGPLEIFRRPEQFADFTLPYYRPLTNLTYWMDSRLWGLRPGGFHCTNWLLHAANTLLTFEVVLALGGRPLLALLAALLFAGHPMHSESVVMVQGRTDLLATLLLLVSLLALFRSLSAPPGGRNALAGCGCLAALAGALLSKETAFTWPVMAGAAVWALPAASRGPRRRWAGLLAGGLVVAAGVLVLRGTILGRLAPVDVPPFDATRLGLGAITLATYLGLLVWPFSFTFLHVLPVPQSLTEPRAAGALLLAAAVGTGLVLLGRRHRLAALGGLWTLIPLLPVLNLFPIPGFALAERYLYLPSVGFCLLAALAADGLARLANRNALRASGLAALAALLGAFALTIQARITEWADPLRAYESMAARAPASFFAQGKLGLEYQRAGRLPEAAAALQRARDLEPGNPVAWNNLGVALAALGRLAEARDAYRQAIRLRPEYVKAHENLAAVLAALGDRAGAEAAVSRARALGARQ